MAEQTAPSRIRRQTNSRRKSPSAKKKRRLILEAAEQLFASRGFLQTTIADVSELSGVHDASIFQYFKTKENLLLSGPANWFDELVEEAEKVFSGRLDAYERLLYLLRRWALDFQVREAETRILILELFRNRAFYNSQAHKNTHRFWRLIRSIIEEGRETGVFRTDFKTDYYLHLIQGAFEHEALARMTLARKKPTVGAIEQMIRLLLAAIRA